jgi:hypothetical protein
MSDSASSAAGLLSAGERNEPFSKRRGGYVIAERKKQAIQHAAWLARHRQEKQTSDATSRVAGMTAAGERNRRFSQRRGG